MKNSIVLVLIMIMITSCQDQQKVAFIENSKVINEYQKKKDVEAKFKIKDQAFQKRTDSISKAFQLEAQDFQLNASKMTQAKQQEQYQALGQKQQLLQQQIQFEDQQLQKQFQTEIDSVVSNFKTFVKDYGKANGYAYILGSNEAGSVLYGSEENDITQVIIDALNNEYKNAKK